MIQLSGVSKCYNGQNQVLNQVDLNLKRGDFLYVVGGSGAGKSSLLRMLATEEQPTTGVVSLFGYRLDQASPSTMRTIRHALGYVPQDLRLLADFSVLENVLFSANFSGGRAFKAAVQPRRYALELLDKLGLAGKKDTMAAKISGGEAQRVALARALVRKPELVVCDEPTGAQDQEFTWQMMELLMRINTGSTIVIATHDREIVRRIRKRCAVIRNGKIFLEEGPCSF